MRVSKSRAMGADFHRKMKGLGDEIFETFWIWRAEILAKNKTGKCSFFFSKKLKWEGGGWRHMSGALMENW